MKCKVCNERTKYIFQGEVLGRHKVKYFHCESCGFMQTEEPYWLEEAYSSSINDSDTGYVLRNTVFSNKVTTVISLLFNRHAMFLDYASGYGVFVRQMRDIGFDFYWNDKYTKNIFAIGFEQTDNQHFEAITTFESFEHFVDPLSEIEKMLNISKTIIFSTETLPSPIPSPGEWWYFGSEHGQHISFYSKTTFEFLASKYEMNYYYIDSLHILTNKKLHFSHKFIGILNKLKIYYLLRKFLTSKTWLDHSRMAGLTSIKDSESPS